MKTLLTSILVVILALAIEGCDEYRERSPALSASDNAGQTVALRSDGRSPESIKALFIYRPQSFGKEDVVAWQEVLAQYGIEVFVKAKQQLEAADFSGIDLVMVGTGQGDWTRGRRVFRIGKLELNPQPWEGRKITRMLSKSRLPILEIGVSEHSLFHKLGSPDRLALGKHKPSVRLVFRVPEDAQEYLREPFPIDDSQIVLASTAAMFWYCLPPPSMDGIVEDVNQPGLYPVVRYQQYVSWRLGRDAQRLPEEGKRLFANIAYALVRDDGERTDAERLADLRQRNYDNALEYYNRFGSEPFSWPGLRAKILGDSPSVEQKRLYAEANRLWEFQLDWHVETPDVVVSAADRDAVNHIIDQRFPDEAARQKWEDVTLRFYDGRRCHVAIVRHWDHRSVSGWGNDLYLIKHDGEWKVIREHAWI